MSFTYTFQQTTPTGLSSANQIDEYILADVKKALAERYELEHVALDSSETGADDPTSANAQGRHIPGKVSCLFSGTYTQLAALSSPGVGSIGYATDTNSFYRYDSVTGWTALTVSANVVVPDDITLEITGTSASGAAILGMKHDNQQWVTEYALTDVATIETDCDNSNTFTVTLGGNRTLDAPTNMKAGATYLWRITQDGAGSRTLSFNSVFKFPGGVAPVLTTDAGALDMIAASCDGTNLYCSVMYDIK